MHEGKILKDQLALNSSHTQTSLHRSQDSNKDFWYHNCNSTIKTIYNFKVLIKPLINIHTTHPIHHPSLGKSKLTSKRLTASKSKTVSRQNLVDRLEVSDTSAGAVTGATGGDTLGLSTAVEGTARVTGLSADGSLSEASDTAFGVGDGGTESADSAAEDTGGGTGAADAGTGGGGGAAGDGKGAASVVVDAALVGVARAAADVGVVVAGEAGAREGTDGGTGAGSGSVASGTAVAGGDESTGDGETDGAAAGTVDVVGVTTTDGSEGGGHGGNGLDLVLGVGETNLLGEVGSGGGAVGESLKDELVGGNVDVVGGDARLGALGGLEVHVVKSSLGLLELGERDRDEEGLSTGGLDLGGGGLVGDGNGKVTVNEVGTTEGGTGGGTELLDDIGGLELAGNTGVGLLGIKSKVALHGSEDVGVQAVGSSGRGTVDDGQEDCHGSEEVGENHGEDTER